ncbi:MAG: hypothetical protein GF372_09265 [Candidatus Marinimicrobia bacterium]|nr:hypothetical protein [Candidatus Neomarinimicrobiota bacterium]
MNTPKIILIVSALILIGIFPSESTGQNTVRGYVLDDSTGLTLAGANVFLNNTTLGSATNEQGYFEITNIPPGRYDLVASYIGYELQTRSLVLEAQDTLRRNFSLEPSPFQGDEVVVEEEYPKRRKRQIQRFREIFLGETRLARFCSIQNPEVLIFMLDDFRGGLHVYTREPLIIINDGLGYKMSVHISRFVWSDHAKYFVTRTQYTELVPRAPTDRIRWENNRREAYRGSRKHFLKSLIEGNMWNEGFQVVHQPYATSLRSAGIMGLSGTHSTMIPNPHEEFIQVAETDGQFLLDFQGSLHIEYRRRSEKSFIKIRYPVSLDEYGNVVIPPGLTDVLGFFQEGGQWGKERMADALPTDLFYYK